MYAYPVSLRIVEFNAESAPDLCAPITSRYTLNIKRRRVLKCVTHRAYGRPYALCVVASSNAPVRLVQASYSYL